MALFPDCDLVGGLHLGPGSGNDSEGVEGGQGGGRGGLQSSSWRSDGVQARPRPARPRRGQRALPGRGSGSTNQQHRQQPQTASGGAGLTDGQTEGEGVARPAGVSNGGSFIRRGPCRGCPGPCELCTAAPDPAAGCVLGEWPPPRYPIPPCLASLVPLPSPSPPFSSSLTPPPPAAGWSDVTRLGAPTCGRGRGWQRQPGTLRGHHRPPPTPNSSLGLTSLSQPSPRFSCPHDLEAGIRLGTGFTERLGHSASTQGGGYRSLEDQAVSPCFHTHILRAPSRELALPRSPVATVSWGNVLGFF